MSLNTQSIQSIKSTLDNFVKDGSPGLVFHAIDKSGKTLVEHASGTIGINSSKPMDVETTTFWVASCTKLVTAIAVLQLVEQGKIGLDDAEAVRKIAPELAKKKVYADGVNGVEQERGITMRMLLSHTAGFGYKCFDPRIKGDGIEGDQGDINDFLDAKLLNQPGSMWEYGINIDWAGLILERLTNQKLGDYFQQHIFTPLDIPAEGASILPSPSTQETLAQMHQRDATTGTLSPRPQLLSGALSCPADQQKQFFHSGGGGLWTKPREYVKILAALLNNGTSPSTHAQILKPATVDLLCENQIPDQPNFARGGPPPANPLIANRSAEMYPQPGNPPQGWGFGGFITFEPGLSGRGRNTVWWSGLSNCFWWVDRERGAAGMLAAQVLPYGDPKVVPAWFMAEKGIYDGLDAVAAESKANSKLASVLQTPFIPGFSTNIFHPAHAWPSSTSQTLSPRAVSYLDAETGFTFSETRAAATLSSSIIYRIAQPANVPTGQPYDVVLQVIAPNALGWVGLAWGGSMIRNPLTVSYPNGQKPTVSSRWATGHSTPQPYPSATYTPLTAGNKSNATHWQFTVKCSGCTTYTGSTGSTVRIDPTGSKRLGFACSQGKVSNPSSTSASIPVHDVYNYITHDFSVGASEGWEALLARNGV
ncbi:beta-lactamase transpeptidase-like protein [Stemphylium lycopersici]|uniref:Beta-lactamase/transpeptidase-like protein n=1 Tax=Stemphylium lycopersici TaxID=183478 RepID=A0A364MSK3_STELY|nr:beta-lactamase transpeptidase-like protein [Stemphylium lycopersici]RAR02186.1 beta-lactamase/transpeptidase-like protein [Stemphylium lycopersici]